MTEFFCADCDVITFAHAQRMACSVCGRYMQMASDELDEGDCADIGEEAWDGDDA